MPPSPYPSFLWNPYGIPMESLWSIAQATPEHRRSNTLVNEPPPAPAAVVSDCCLANQPLERKRSPRAMWWHSRSAFDLRLAPPFHEPLGAAPIRRTQVTSDNEQQDVYE